MLLWHFCQTPPLLTYPKIQSQNSLINTILLPRNPQITWKPLDRLILMIKLQVLAISWMWFKFLRIGVLKLIRLLLIGCTKIRWKELAVLKVSETVPLTAKNNLTNGEIRVKRLLGNTEKSVFSNIFNICI